MTSLGEFSPVRRLFSLGIFSENTKEAFLATFIHGKSYALILTKNGLATFWGTF
jgi:hypothetical protein